MKLEGRGRVKFPKFDRPMIRINNGNFEILDLSPIGVKFKGTKDLSLDRQNEYIVELIFVEQKPIKTKAKLARKVGDLFALAFTKAVPEKILLKEAERIKKRHGDVKIS